MKRTVSEVFDFGILPQFPAEKETDWFAVPPRARAIIRQRMAELDESEYERRAQPYIEDKEVPAPCEE
jgi:hypothetical protein